MTKIKIKHVITFSSQDPKHTVENIITGKGEWLGDKNESSPNIKMEVQLDKASKIDYIDIANSNTAMLGIEVGQSSWPTSSAFKILLPTVVLMTPLEARIGENAKAVRMFKNVDFIQETSCEKWDRVRITCSQPFRKDSQYGLTFINFYEQQETATANQQVDVLKERTMKELFESVRQLPTKKMSPSLKSIENTRIVSEAFDDEKEINTSRTVVDSPMSRGAKLMMAVKHKPNHGDTLKQKKDLEMKALEFLLSLNLTYEDIHSLKVSNLREEFERKRNSFLTTSEKLVFKNLALDFATKLLNRFDEEKNSKNFKENSILTKNKNMSTTRSPFMPISATNNRTNMATTSQNFSIQKTNKYTFKRFNKNYTQDSPTSVKRARMRDEEPIVPQSPRGFNRNNLSLTDCNQSSPRQGKCIITPKSKQSKKNQDNGSSIPTLDRWISAKDDCSVNLEEPNMNSNSSFNGDEICIDNSEYFKQNLSSSGVLLNQMPIDKYGVTGKLLNSKSGTLKPSVDDVVECPLCTGLFNTKDIENHAASCNPSESSSTNTVEMGECPICQNMFEMSKITSHAEVCAQEIFID